MVLQGAAAAEAGSGAAGSATVITAKEVGVFAAVGSPSAPPALRVGGLYQNGQTLANPSGAPLLQLSQDCSSGHHRLVLVGWSRCP